MRGRKSNWERWVEIHSMKKCVCSVWLKHRSAGAQNCSGEVPLGYKLNLFLCSPQGISPTILQGKMPIFTGDRAQPLSWVEDWCGRRQSPGSAPHNPLQAPSIQECKKVIKCPCVSTLTPEHISSLVNSCITQSLLYFSWCTCTMREIVCTCTVLQDEPSISFPKNKTCAQFWGHFSLSAASRSNAGNTVPGSALCLLQSFCTMPAGFLSSDTFSCTHVMFQNMKHLSSGLWCKRTAGLQYTFLLLQGYRDILLTTKGDLKEQPV